MTPLVVDFTQLTVGVIFHQVNCLGVMGAGLALSLRKKWPILFERYSSYVSCQVRVVDSLGDAQRVEVQPGLWVVNVFGQYSFAGEPAGGTNLKALQQALESDRVQDLRAWALTNEIPMYTPLLGCGLGGAKKSEVLPILEATIPEAYLCTPPHARQSKTSPPLRRRIAGTASSRLL